MEDRAEHLAWCKKRALEYLDHGDVKGALTSMNSDLSKHEDLKQSALALAPLGLSIAMNNDVAAARAFIEGFQ